jgi:ElaB/YqjD/DUF883 family membrane-anchored ribosome-binding protein
MGTLSADNGLGDKLKDVIDAGQEKLEAAKGRIIDGKERVQDGATRGYAAAMATIKEHPFMAIGIAFGLGYLGTRLLRR